MFRKLRFLSPMAIFAIGFAVLVSACAGKHKPSIRPGILTSSYDYTPPSDVGEKNQPVWILPTISKGWMPAQVDKRTNQWVSGHYTATVTEPGHWATLEEAELSGKPYLLAGETDPVVPLPLQDGKKAPAPSDVSLQNQLLLPNHIPSDDEPVQATYPKTDEKPAPLNVPGLTAPQTATPKPSVPKPSATPTPPILPPVVPAPNQVSTVDPSPATIPPAKTTGEMRTGAVHKDAPARYVATTNDIYISRAPAGTTTTVKTQDEYVLIAYVTGDKCNVTYQGKTQSISFHGKSDAVKFHLSK